jgi:hypothetical protein
MDIARDEKPELLAHVGYLVDGLVDIGLALALREALAREGRELRPPGREPVEYAPACRDAVALLLDLDLGDARLAERGLVRVVVARGRVDLGQEVDAGYPVVEVLLLELHLVHLALERALDALADEAREHRVGEARGELRMGQFERDRVVAQAFGAHEAQEHLLGVGEVLLRAVGVELGLLHGHPEVAQLGLGRRARLKARLLGLQRLLGELQGELLIAQVDFLADEAHELLPDRHRELPVGVGELLLGYARAQVADDLRVPVGAPLENRLVQVQAVVEALRRARRTPRDRLVPRPGSWCLR